MPAEGKHRIFLDASVRVAAAGSPTGGSALVVEVCGGRCFVNDQVREAGLPFRVLTPGEFIQQILADSPRG